MKTLIIPDIHNRTDLVEGYVAKVRDKYDEIVFLGDYFDHFHDGPTEAGLTAAWLKHSLKDPKRIHLIGNHDMPYMLPREFLWCPGWSKEKHKRVNEVMKPDDWLKLHPIYLTQGWLLSHAGASPKIFSHPINGVSAESIVKQVHDAYRDIRSKLPRPEFGYGQRMSMDVHLTGGITWLDWAWEFIPIPGVNQVVGHSIQAYPDSNIIGGSENWCIDTNNRDVAVIEAGYFKTLPMTA